MPSPPDIVFYPLAAALAAGLTIVALGAGAARLPTGPMGAGRTDAAVLAVEGRDLARFVAGPRDVVELRSAPGQPLLLRVTGVRRESAAATPTQTANLRLAPDLEAAYGGKAVRITITARAAADAPAPFFKAGYAAAAGADSGWTEFPLTDAFQDYAFEYRPPQANLDDLGLDFVGIMPDPSGGGGAVEIRKIVFDARATKPALLPPDSSPAARETLP